MAVERAREKAPDQRQRVAQGRRRHGDQIEQAVSTRARGDAGVGAELGGVGHRDKERRQFQPGVAGMYDKALRSLPATTGVAPRRT